MAKKKWEEKTKKETKLAENKEKDDKKSKFKKSRNIKF